MINFVSMFLSLRFVLLKTLQFVAKFVCEGEGTFYHIFFIFITRWGTRRYTGK